LPAVGTLGNAAPNIFRGPGVENWDRSLIKNVTLYERLHFQFRAAAFNTFNHTQFTTVNTAANFNPTTGAQILARCSWVSGWFSKRGVESALPLDFILTICAS
jgi:hypothetical protein